MIKFLYKKNSKGEKVKIAKKLIASVAVAGALASMANAGEINVNLYGASYHLKASEAYHNAPRSIGNEGQWVFNPGIGLEYDFRTKGSTGFSVFTGAGYFRDCGDYPFYFAELGVRYKNYFWNSNHWFWEVSLGGAYAVAHDWDVDNNGNAVDYGTTTTGLPVGGIGFGYKFKNGNFLKYTLTYVPKNDDIGATGGTNLIFMWLTYGF
jgi:hypothetical protein